MAKEMVEEEVLNAYHDKEDVFDKNHAEEDVLDKYHAKQTCRFLDDCTMFSSRLVPAPFLPQRASSLGSSRGRGSRGSTQGTIRGHRGLRGQHIWPLSSVPFQGCSVDENIADVIRSTTIESDILVHLTGNIAEISVDILPLTSLRLRYSLHDLLLSQNQRFLLSHMSPI